MRIRAWWLAVSLFGLVGCGGGAAANGRARVGGEGPGVPDAAVSDDAFAASLRALFASAPGSAERASRLAGIESRQMERAVLLFKKHDGKRGLAAVLGGLQLLRAGELREGTLGPMGAEALKGAARELSARGDEGRAEGAFQIWLRIAKPADRAEIQTHLDALAQWVKSLAKGSPLVVSGELENVAVARRSIEPSKEAIDLATSRTTAWIDKAFELRQKWAQSLQQVRRDEEMEEARVEQMGGAVLASIYLRDGDAAGAIAAIDKAQAQDLVRDDMLQALRAAAKTPSAEKWLEVIHQLAPPRRDEQEETLQDDEIVRAAIFAIASEAYRYDPTEIEPSLRVAAQLGDFGMGEAAPLFLEGAVKAHPDPRVVRGALQITMRAMQHAVEVDEPDAARRTFRAAKGLLDLSAPFAGKVEPSAARVRAFMGEIEVRDGRLEDARALFEESVKEEKSGSVLLELARIDRHDKRPSDAVAHLRDALAAKDAAEDPALRGEILLETSDLAREQGDAKGARTPLTGALSELTKARNAADPDDRARVERVLARVLSRFGATQPAQRALDRAYEAAPHDKHQAAATVGLIVASAFVRGDLQAAREGLQRGVAADLSDEDIVYYALWVRLLEKQLKVATDGVADRVLAQALDHPGWIGRIARFGAGLTKPGELMNEAKTPAQKTEALFYTAMDRRVAGDAKAADSGLREVVGGNGIDLMEVAIARDLLDGPKARVPGPIPNEAQ